MNAFMSYVGFPKVIAAAFAIGVVIASSNAHANLGQDKRVRVVNRTGQDIVAVLTSHDYDETFGSNRLNMDALPSGFSVVINPHDGGDGCVYDFLAVMQNGSWFMKELDACYASQVVFWGE
jgi:hypothetical protein